MMLSENEKKRYHRHLILPDFGEEAQLKLKASKVLVVGAGGLGSPVLTYLAAAGIGKIGIVENDTVDISNLQRQILYSTNELGKPKAKAAKEKLEQLNTEIEIEIYQEWLTDDNAKSIISGYDLVVDCPDNFKTRKLVGRITSDLNIPHVFGAIFQYEGQVGVFNVNGAPAYHEFFPDLPDDKATKDEDKGVLGVLPGIIGTIQANEAIKLITGVGDTLAGKLLLVDTLKMSFLTVDM